jgi:nickel-type superoxide dismutase maturation protease
LIISRRLDALTIPTAGRDGAPGHRGTSVARAAVVVAGLGALWAAAAAGERTLRRVVVEGHSMEPTLLPGDRLLVVRWPLRAGQTVAVRDPRDPRRILVKRVGAVLASGSAVDLRGDNPAASTDSRNFGPVDSCSVLGRVVYRYHPPGRAGWWP